jgi:uncharacterized SAM-binding protein YcdF (DUF218 family)
VPSGVDCVDATKDDHICCRDVSCPRCAFDRQLHLRRLSPCCRGTAAPQRADVGLVLAGHFGRALYAADLYHQGFIPKIWISRLEREKYLVQLDSIGVPYPRQEEISRAVLLKNGVPDDRIEVIGDGMVSSIAEARFVAGLLEKQPEIHSLLLITSRFHVRRAQAIFDRVVVSAFPVHIMTVGSPYDGFIADQWWRDRDSAREVLLETAKLLLFWTKEEF